MSADVTQAMNTPCRIAKQDKVLAQHAYPDRFVGDIFGELSGVPEIYKHRLPQLANNFFIRW